MRIKHGLCALLLALLLHSGAQASRAAVFNVSPRGDNAGDGSAARPWKTLDFAATQAPADAGHTIRLSEGAHDLSRIATLPSGVNLIGAGRLKTTINCKYFFDFEGTRKPRPADWLPDAFCYDPSAPQSAILQVKGSQQTIQGFTMDGQGKRCIAGLLVRWGKNLTIDGVGFRHFKIAGLWMHEVYDTQVKNCDFLDNSWGNKNQAYGALQFNRADRLSIHGNTISERGTGCYGIKMMDEKVSPSMYSDPGAWQTKTLNDGVQISNNRIEVDENGTWSTEAGGHAPSIAIEFNSDIEARNVDIHHNWFNNHLSIVSWELGQDTGYHIHHNFFDLRSDDKKGSRYSYMVEANESNFEIDHNIVLGGYYPISTWHFDKSRNRGHLVHHNVFHGPAGRKDLWMFGDQSGHDGYRFYNNTVIDTQGTGTIFTVANSERRNLGASIKNNIFLSTLGPRGDILGNANALEGADIVSNLFWNITPRGSKSLAADPSIALANLSFALGKDSPAIDAGVSITGITDGAVGAPDLGAFEYGQPPWKAGVPGNP